MDRLAVRLHANRAENSYGSSLMIGNLIVSHFLLLK